MADLLMGTQTRKDLALPSSIDAGHLKQVENQEGLTYFEFVERVVAALALYNPSLLTTHRFLPKLTYPTTDLVAEYGQGSRPKFTPRTELTRGHQYVGKDSGHMFPLDDDDMALGFSVDWLESTTNLKVNQAIRNLLTAGNDLLEIKALQALFRSIDVNVGQTGLAVPLVGGGSVAFEPQSYEGVTFPSHDHFLRFTEAEIGLAAVTATEHLREHGHPPPYQCIIPDTDKALWIAVDDSTNGAHFVKNTQIGVQHNITEDRTLEIAGLSPYIGLIETPAGSMWLMPVSRLETKYFAVYKSYGAASPMNPVAWRFDPGKGGGIFVMNSFLMGHQTLDIIPRSLNGFNIGNDRTNGVCCKLAPSGDYTDPTIS
jgi:hypothetical protein